jgi:hypothetical protein
MSAIADTRCMQPASRVFFKAKLSEPPSKPLQDLRYYFYL